MKLAYQVMTSESFPGKKDPSKSYTRVEGICTLPDGNSAFCEVFLDGKYSYAPGSYEMECAIAVNRQTRRLEVRVSSVLPSRVAQPRAA